VDSIFKVVPDFFDDAEALRASFDAHFSEPCSFDEWNMRRVWNYWYVPGAYTYLRADPPQVLSHEPYERFMMRLKTWSAETLGLSVVRRPILSMYVSGCGQNLHNDANNGRFAYVYSLTRWDRRKFTGGETLILPEESYWSSKQVTEPTGPHSGTLLKIDAKFNQLLIFDDRAIHGVETVLGSMDPREARVVLHGHIVAEPIFDGALTLETFGDAWRAQLPPLEAMLDEHADAYTGMLVLRWSISAGGEVDNLEVVSNRIRVVEGGALQPELLERVKMWARSLHFPRADGPSRITIPLHRDVTREPHIGSLGRRNAGP
jgi:hypothetical protein